ncbi:MAG: hypothetical protein KDJ37_12470 [Hyphomicrobiaceae bacterium]|nr:hypothetical protein [Hyphomicrobiaceae bacterium]
MRAAFNGVVHLPGVPVLPGTEKSTRRAHRRPAVALALIARLSVALIGASAAVTAVRAEGQADNGQKLAETHCSRCHVIGSFNPHGGIGSTPSFRLLVTALADWRERFETFYARRPHPAFVAIEGIGRPREDLPPNAHPVTLPKSALDDLVALAERMNAAAATMPPSGPARK